MKRPPPNPFEECEADLVRRVAAGELSAEQAVEIAALVRTMACSRRARGLRRTIERLEREVLKLLADLRRSREAEAVAIDATIFYAKEYERRRGDRRAREAREEWREEQNTGDPFAREVRRWREEKRTRKA